MADLQTTYISDLTQEPIQDSTLFITDDGTNTNSATAADVANFAKDKILPEANSYADTKKSEAIEENKEYTNGVISNPNLLINSNFKNPINQRGQTTYIGSGTNQYTIDRWRIKGVATVLTILTNGDGISLGKSDTLTGYALLEQAVENSEILEGKVLTASTSVDGNIISCTVSAGWTFPAEGMATLATARYENLDIKIQLYSDKILTVYIYIGGSIAQGTTYNLQWAKLELGNVATQYVPSTTGEELLLCKRYYMAFPKYFSINTIFAYSSGQNNQFSVPLYPTMRITPTADFVNCKMMTTSSASAIQNVTFNTTASTPDMLYINAVTENTTPNAVFVVNAEKGLTLDAEIY